MKEKIIYIIISFLILSNFYLLFKVYSLNGISTRVEKLEKDNELFIALSGNSWAGFASLVNQIIDLRK